MAQRDYYEVLGVPREASQEQIKKAFRRLAREHHPDLNNDPSAKDRFKEINAAYEILNDPDKRRRYDRFGHAGVSGDSGFGGGFGAAGFGGLDEIFEEFFSGFGGTSRRSTRRRGPRQGRDLGYDLTIDFEAAVFGAKQEIEINRLEVCDTCHGSGAEPGSVPQRCPECRGTGEIQTVRQTILGSMISVNTCPRCDGRGEIITDPCEACNGSGRNRINRTLTVDVPAGVDDGMRIRYQGEGEPGENGGPPGNLYVTIRVRPHKYFQRRRDDILLEVTINVAQAALGDTITVPTVEGDDSVTIPAGTQTGESFRLRGKGFPRLRKDGSNTGRGDQYIVVQVAVPKKLNDRQRELFEELAETLDTDLIRPSQKGFFDRVMNFFSGEG